MPLDPFEITGGIAIGTGLGAAIGDTVEPRLRKFKFEQSSKYLYIPLSPGEAAEVAAEDFATYEQMRSEAEQWGYNPERFQHLYDVTLTAPGMGELLALLRRGAINPGNFTHGLRKAKLEPMWDDGLASLKDVRIPGPDLAYMVVRGVVPDGGTLPGSLPTHSDNLDLPPQLAIDTLDEASQTGWDPKRFAGLVARSGLAMAPGLAAQAHFRKILTENDYLLTIARGDLFPAFADPMLEVSRQILTAGEYAELQLRGFLTAEERRAKTALHGMTDENSDLLYDVQGRAPSVHTVLIGLRRGGVYDGPTDHIPRVYLEAMERSNLRPEWFNIAYAARQTYPSAFVIRALLQGNAINAARGADLFNKIGWPEDLATEVADFYGQASTTPTDPHIVKAENQLWTTLHRSYVAAETDDATATATLPLAGAAADSVAGVLRRWQAERELIRKQLTPAQVKKAYAKAAVNAATNEPWTRDEALAALIERGYASEQALSYLNI